MPLYVADYLADTSHFSAAEHGAYLLLIMHYWQTGGLPGDDDARMARIARMTADEWAAARPVIATKFSPSWRHARIDGELEEAERLAKAGKKGGEASGEARRKKRNPRPRASAPVDDDDEEISGGSTASNDPRSRRPTIDERSAKQTANDFRTICEAPQPQPQTDVDADARAREAALALAAEIAELAGFPTPQDWPPGWCGAPLRVQAWLAEPGWGREIILVACREALARKRDGPPNSIVYFEKPIAAAVARNAAALPQVRIAEGSAKVIHVQAARSDRSGRHGDSLAAIAIARARSAGGT